MKTKCASSATPDSWRTIDGVSCKKKVRKLQIRLVEALKANRIGRVKALLRIMINSFPAKVLAVRQVTSNKGGSTTGVDKETWLTNTKHLPTATRMAFAITAHERMRQTKYTNAYARDTHHNKCWRRTSRTVSLVVSLV